MSWSRVPHPLTTSRSSTEAPEEPPSRPPQGGTTSLGGDSSPAWPVGVELFDLDRGRSSPGRDVAFQRSAGKSLLFLDAGKLYLQGGS